MQQDGRRRTNRERTESTRAVLVAAARTLFTGQSYAETGTPEIVEAAGVTRGALYHHFADKRALFAAVVEQEAEAVAADIEQAARPAQTAREALLCGADAYIAAMQAPGRTRLLLLDGPSVLGRTEMDAVDARHAARTLREGLTAAMAEGAVRPLDLDTLTAILSAAFDRAALAVEGGASPKDVRSALSALLYGLTVGRE